MCIKKISILIILLSTISTLANSTSQPQLQGYEAIYKRNTVQAKEFKDYDLLYQNSSAPVFKNLIGDWRMIETAPVPNQNLHLYPAEGGPFFEANWDENHHEFRWQTFSNAMIHGWREDDFKSSSLEAPGMRFFYSDKINKVVSVLMRRHAADFDDMDYFHRDSYYLDHSPWKYSTVISNDQTKTALYLKTINFQYEAIYSRGKSTVGSSVGVSERDHYVGTHFISLNQYNKGFKAQTVKGSVKAELKDLPAADEFCRITASKDLLICRVEGQRHDGVKPFCGYRVFKKLLSKKEN